MRDFRSSFLRYSAFAKPDNAKKLNSTIKDLRRIIFSQPNRLYLDFDERILFNPAS